VECAHTVGMRQHTETPQEDNTYSQRSITLQNRHCCSQRNSFRCRGIKLRTRRRLHFFVLEGKTRRREQDTWRWFCHSHHAPPVTPHWHQWTLEASPPSRPHSARDCHQRLCSNMRTSTLSWSPLLQVIRSSYLVILTQELGLTATVRREW